jgi:hypothetical protein
MADINEVYSLWRRGFSMFHIHTETGLEIREIQKIIRSFEEKDEKRDNGNRG